MSRQSSRAVARYSDGEFTVVAEKRGNHHSYRVRAWFRGQPPTTEAAPTATEAEEAARSIWLAYSDGILENPTETLDTLGKLIATFAEREDLRPATKRSYDEVLQRFATAVGESRGLGSVRMRDVQRWLDSLTCSATSKATYLRTLRACFRWAKKEGHVDHVATDGVSTPKASRHLRAWLPHHEWDRFLKACPHAHRVRAEFALETGLRKGELIHAQWDWLATTAGRQVIRVAADRRTQFVPKWGQARAVPLSQRAAAVLDEARALWGPRRFIFADNGLRSDVNFAHKTRVACQAAKVTEVDFHGLRRSAGARWLELGFSMHEVAKLLGHQSVTTTERWYAGVGDRHLVSLFDKVDGPS